MESRAAMGPAALRYTDAVIGCLRAGGFSPAMTAHAFLLLDSYIYGFVVQELSFQLDSAEEAAEPATGTLDSLADAYPHLAEMATEYAAGYDYAGEFEFGLDLILDGLEAHRHGGGA